MVADYSKVKYLGCAIQDFQVAIGWGTQKTTITINLVEDPLDNDVFMPPPLGTPSFFNLEGEHVGNFEFYGILQRYEKRQSQSGYPVYNVVLEDPRDILDGTEVILSGYYNPVSGVDNILNVFGYFESSSFGSSEYNEAGMPWAKIKQGVTELTKTVSSAYGSRLSFRGHRYKVDLSEMPEPPDFYRLNANPSTTLLSLIDTLCRDGGHDFFVELIPPNRDNIIGLADTATIKIRTIDRTDESELGVIPAVVEARKKDKTLVSSVNGIEIRNETTSVFIAGGQRQDMWQIEGSALMQYFGLDELNQPIVVTPGTGLTDNAGNKVADDEYFDSADLWAKDIEDIIGSDIYPCQVVEMCCAVVDQKNWESYLEAMRPSMAQTIGLSSVFIPPFANAALGGGQPAGAIDMYNFSLAAVQARASEVSTTIKNHYVQRVYQFVRKAAEEYLGKKYLCPIPFTLFKIEPETEKIVTSNEVVDSGYIPEDFSPLGLDKILQERLKVSDGKYGHFAKYEKIADADFNKLANGQFVIGSDGIFVRCGVDSTNGGIIVYNGAPHVVLEVSNPLYEAPTDVTGAGLPLAAALFQTDPEYIIRILRSGASGIFNFKVKPKPKKPDYAAIALKSTINTYGPWFKQGKPGKVRFEVDASLVPWNFGGFPLLEKAGSAKVTQAITKQQMVETGSIEVAGFPEKGVGDILESGGPNITNIDVKIGTGGVTTSYRFTTFTARYGVFNRGNVERIQRIGRTMQAMNASLRTAMLRIFAPSDTQVRENISLMYDLFTPEELKGHSPHIVFIGEGVKDPNKLTRRRNWLASMTGDEAARHTGAEIAGEWERKAITSMDGLLRPFTTKKRKEKELINREEAGGKLSAEHRQILDVITAGKETDEEYNEAATSYDGDITKEVVTMVNAAGEIVGTGMSQAEAATNAQNNKKDYQNIYLPSYYETKYTEKYKYGLICKDLDPFKNENDISIYSYGSTYKNMATYNTKGPGFPDEENVRGISLKGPLVVTGWGWTINGHPVPSSTELQKNEYGQKFNIDPPIGLVTFDKDYLRKSHRFKTGPVDLLWDENRGVWTSHDVCMGKLHFGPLREWDAKDKKGIPINSGLMNIYQNASSAIEEKKVKRTVYNFMSQEIPSGSRVMAAWVPEANSWWVFAADCV